MIWAAEARALPGDSWIVAGYRAHCQSVFRRGRAIRLDERIRSRRAGSGSGRRQHPLAVRPHSNRQESRIHPLALLETGRNLAERIPYSLIALASRIAVAAVFWRSGQTKVNGFSIREETFFLFREEYKVPLLPPDFAAYLSTIAEHVFPVLLVVGLATRLSALGLFGMTLVIQLFVFPSGWPEHILWFSLLGLIIARGPGAISLDHLIWNARPAVPAVAPAAR